MTQPTIVSSLPRAAGILDALEAVKNWRAVALVALTFAAAGIEFAVFSALSIKINSVGIGMLGTLFALLIGVYGISAVGFMLMQGVLGKPALGIMQALIISLMHTHRWLIIVALALAAFLAFGLTLVLILLVCKIPVLGPVLYTVVLPIAALLAGLFIAAMGFVVAPLTFPAVWQGRNVMQVLSALWTITRQRLFQVIVLVVLLSLLYGFVAAVVMGIVFSGLSVAAGFSALVLPVGGVGGVGTHFPGLMNMGYAGNGYLTAGALGSGLLLILAMTIPALVLLRGYCLIYLQVSEGLNFTEAEAQLQVGMQTMQRKAQEKMQPPTPSNWHCSKCNATVAADEIFCSSCGHKLP